MPQKGDATKQHIIEKAMHLFATKGYKLTSMGDIAEAAGLTKGGIYGHFTNKKDIWLAAHKECTRVWRRIVLDGVEGVEDPLQRVQKVIENSMTRYIGGEVFEGGCLLFGSLVEHTGTSSELCEVALKGFTSFTRMLRSWLDEAVQKGLVRDDVDLQAVANLVVVALSGAGPLYTASRNPEVWQQTMSQLTLYVGQLRKQA